MPGRGCEQGDALAPALLSFGQHDGLEHAAGNLYIIARRRAPEPAWTLLRPVSRALRHRVQQNAHVYNAGGGEPRRQACASWARAYGAAGPPTLRIRMGTAPAAGRASLAGTPSTPPDTRCARLLLCPSMCANHSLTRCPARRSPCLRRAIGCSHGAPRAFALTPSPEHPGLRAAQAATNKLQTKPRLQTLP